LFFFKIPITITTGFMLVQEIKSKPLYHESLTEAPEAGNTKFHHGVNWPVHVISSWLPTTQVYSTEYK
jgi:hypothetical protein